MDQQKPRTVDAAYQDKLRRERSKVRQQLKEVRLRLEHLEFGRQRGQDNTADIEACKGQMEVLNKELVSIDEGGHTTFVAAKEEMMAPKQGISDKQRSIESRRMACKKELFETESKLEDPELSSADREVILAEASELKKKLASISRERRALQEFNHTRFVQLRKEKVDTEKQANDLQEVDRKIAAAETARSEAEASGDAAQIDAARRGVHLLLMEKQSIENFTHDLFLKNLERMKAENESELE